MSGASDRLQTRPRAMLTATAVIGLTMSLAAACSTADAPEGLGDVTVSPSASGSSTTTAAGELSDDDVLQRAGIVVPDEATDVEVRPNDSELDFSYAIALTLPADRVDDFCADAGLQSSLPFAADFSADDRTNFGLDDGVDAQGARICEGILSGTQVNREILFVPRADDTMMVRAVAFESPR